MTPLIETTTPTRPARRPTAPDGFVIVDKPTGWTSHDVVGRMRHLAGTRKVGHAGTLDPMATGVLVIGVGKATKLLTYVVGAEKQYDATIRLGIGTTTDDAEGEVTATPGYPSTTASASEGGTQDLALQAALASLTGDIMQVPTAVSAIKVDGKRAYARVRAGEQVELPARPVTVNQFDVLAARTTLMPSTTSSGVSDNESPEPGETIPVLDLDVTVTVSSGTYVRALARDLGAALGTAGHLTALRRTRVGGNTLADAHTLEQLTAQADAAGVLATIPLAEAAAAHLPSRELTAAEARELSFGRWIAPTGTAEPVAALTADGTLIAVLTDTRRGEETLAKPTLVLTPANG
ncbi:MAG: tRNA pseudouridine(55) synthase TruB [Promicromonosporaceae bacterium]|nr:tRNA pseudouridine(55) synthase TruB [Promicromonosporaceae bacterium]